MRFGSGFTERTLLVTSDEGSAMKKEMLINVLQPEESRIAILENGVLEELYVERNSQGHIVGNIYKGKVVNLEPSIQAAFIDFGIGRNGFLHVSDVEYEYYKHLIPEDQRKNYEGGEAPTGGRHKPKLNERSVRNKPSIQDIFKRGSEVLVQVIKEGVGSKGPTLSTYISIPGRYVVLMPALQRVGVSRKIEDDDARKALRTVLRELSPPEGVGFIVRTAGLNRTRKELQRDLNYLLRLWRMIVRRIRKTPGPAEIHEESDMVTRNIRDIYTPEIDTIWIDEPQAYERIREFMRVVLPRHVNHVKLYEGKEPLFAHHGIEEEIVKIQNKVVPLKGGGSIVIDQTEALVAIDVNSGTFRLDDNAEETAYQVNLRAAEEIARQIRLRDLGGVIVNDFIDMREERHRRGVEKALRDAVKRDRARTKVLRISPFGLIEMTRQRIRPSLRRSVYEDCPCCAGVGQVKTTESVAIEAVRLMISAAHRERCSEVRIELHQRVADYLHNRKRKEITRIEDEAGITVRIDARHDVGPEHMNVRSVDASGVETRVMIGPDSKK